MGAMTAVRIELTREELLELIRQGVRAELGRFVNGPVDVELFDGVKERLWRYKQAGWRIIAVSNQGGIALGIVSMDNVVRAMQKTQRLTEGAFDKIQFCQHHPAAKDPEYAVCWCRKPRIGGLVEASLDLARQLGEYYPPHMALFVGDRDEDRECAESAGVTFMLASEWRERGEP